MHPLLAAPRIHIGRVAGITPLSNKDGPPSVGLGDWRRAFFAWRCPGRRCLRRGERTDWSAHAAPARRRGAVTRSGRTDGGRRGRLHQVQQKWPGGSPRQRRRASRHRHACRSGGGSFHPLAPFSLASGGRPRHGGCGCPTLRFAVGAQRNRGNVSASPYVSTRRAQHLPNGGRTNPSPPTGEDCVVAAPTIGEDRPVSTAPECWHHPKVTAPGCVGRGGHARAGRPPRGGGRRLPHTRAPQNGGRDGICHGTLPTCAPNCGCPVGIGRAPTQPVSSQRRPAAKPGWAAVRRAGKAGRRRRVRGCACGRGKGFSPGWDPPPAGTCLGWTRAAVLPP